MPQSQSLLSRFLILGFFAVGLSTSMSLAQAPTPDRVEVRDRKDGSIKALTGKLTLTKNGLQLVGTDKKAVLLNFEDILRIVPGELPGVDRLTFNSAFNAEEKRTSKDYESARTIYADLQKKAADPAAKRQLEYRLALVATHLADLEGEGLKWKELAEAAIKEWEGFLLNHSAGWEVWLAARNAARLYVELGRYDAAARLWNRVQKLPELPGDLLLEATVQETDAHFRNKDYASAQRVAAATLKNAKATSFRDRLELYEAAAQEARNGLTPAVVDKIAGLIEKWLEKLTDPLARATAFSILGELYRNVPNRLRDAMWAFLWVETVYNTDKYEAHKAAVRLVEIFQSLKDDERAASQRDRLRQLRESL